MTPSAQRRIAALLGSVALTMGYLVMAQSSTQPADADLGVPSQTGPAQVTAAPTPAPALPALAQLQATVERPLFLAARRAPEPEPAPSVAPVTEERALELVGVMMFDGRRIALIEVEGEDELHRVREDQRLADWRVTRIASDHVVLSLDDLRRELWLVERERKQAARRPGPVAAAGPASEPSQPAPERSEGRPRNERTRELRLQCVVVDEGAAANAGRRCP